VPPHHNLYADYSRKVIEIYSRYTDRVECFGLDECWLDVTGSTKLFGDGKTIADTLRQVVKTELGLTISVGVSFNKIFAKLGSDLKKPDATTVLSRENFREKIWGLNADELIMIGHKTYKKLNNLNIFTIGDLARADLDMIKQNFGIVGERLVLNARGEDDSPVALLSACTQPKSIGHGTTMRRDAKSFEEVKPVVYALADMVATRLRRHGLLALGVHLHIKDCLFKDVGKQCKLDCFTDSANIFAETAFKLMHEIFDFDKKPPIRMLAVSVFDLVDNKENVQASMFENVRQSRLEHSIDRVHERYGYGSIRRGIVLQNSYLCDSLVPLNEDEKPFKKS